MTRKFIKGDFKIEYIYLDVDNKKLVKSYDELVKIYCKGVDYIFEMSHPCYISGQWLIAVSTTPKSLPSLRLILWRMWKQINKSGENNV